MTDFILIPLACYGAYVLVGLPKSDLISSLGYKAGVWLVSKFKA